MNGALHTFDPIDHLVVHVDGEVVDSGDLRPAPQCGLGNGACGLHGRAT